MGFSDLPYRSLCREMGSAISYTEFARAEGLIHNMRRVSEKLIYKEERTSDCLSDLHPRFVDYMVNAALEIQELRPDFIDINMGCPTKAIAQQWRGGGDDAHSVKVARLFKRLSKVLEVPVTGKIRMGLGD